MNIENEEIAVEVSFNENMICLVLADGREVRTPLEFYPRPAKATPAQLKKFKLIEGGTGIHWDELDEDLSVESIVSGRKSREIGSIN